MYYNNKMVNLNHANEFTLLNLIETPFNAFANRTDPDQAALVRAARSGSTLI